MKEYEVPGDFCQVKSDDLQNIKGVCLDIDDTITTDGKLTDQAYHSLWTLKQAGFKVVPVTGRPAGHCDHIVRFWPVDAVIGENGAFIFYMQEGKRQRIDVMDANLIRESQEKIKILSDKVKSSFPQAHVASDQAYREYDLAIDICEDVPAWEDSAVERLITFCQNEGAKCKLSSIHVNIWYGDYDKQTAFKLWLEKEAPGINGSVPPFSDWLYVGDSPNDAPAFACFAKSVGVANLKRYLSKIKDQNRPTWITKSESGAGVAEIVSKLVPNLV